MYSIILLNLRHLKTQQIYIRRPEIKSLYLLCPYYESKGTTKFRSDRKCTTEQNYQGNMSHLLHATGYVNFVVVQVWIGVILAYAQHFIKLAQFPMVIALGVYLTQLA